jgi:hypothetical protein
VTNSSQCIDLSLEDLFHFANCVFRIKGYASRLHDLFIKAGFHLSAEQRESLKDGKSDAQKHSVSEADGFLTLAECSLVCIN